MTRDWDGTPRWPRALRFVASLAIWTLGRFGRRLRRDVADLELRLAGDYVRPEHVGGDTAGWYRGSRIDRRLQDARTISTV